MSEAPGWAEAVLCREVFGVLQHVASRPLSKGHDGPIRAAGGRLRTARAELATLPRRVISETQLRLLATLTDQLDRVPPEVVARTLIGPLGMLLAAQQNGRPDLPCCYASEPRDVRLEHLLVTVGPTIGLGDEFLAARALVGRAAACGVTLHVASHNPELWRCLSPAVRLLAPPPLAAYEYADGLPADVRGRTGLLYADFLTTDVMPTPDTGPAGLGWVGRWAMGGRECDMVDTAHAVRYRFRYPDGLPECRWLEACWMAGRALPGHAGPAPGPGPAAPRPAQRRVLLQALTAKPGLLMPPQFYRAVFERVARRAGSFDLLVVPNPSAQGQRLVLELVDVVRTTMPRVAVEAPGDVALADVYRRLGRADVLVGPDTFTSHFAAARQLPQVTLSLPEHRPWRSIGAPSIAVVANRPRGELVDACADGISVFLEIPEVRERERGLVQAAHAWRTAMDLIGIAVEQSMQGEGAGPDLDLPATVVEAADRHREVALLAGRLWPSSAEGRDVKALDLGRYDNPTDALRAVARWYHEAELTFTAAVARAC